MPNISVNGREIALDEDGFVLNPEQWDEDVAVFCAPDEWVNELTEDHWKVIRYLRDYYTMFQLAPMVRRLCTETGNSLKNIYELFPTGPSKGACKLAGLPKPPGCV